MNKNNDLAVFNFDSHDVRIRATDDGEILFNANDVCTALGFGNPRQALASHTDPEDVQKLDTLDIDLVLCY